MLPFLQRLRQKQVSPPASLDYDVKPRLPAKADFSLVLIAGYPDAKDIENREILSGHTGAILDFLLKNVGLNPKVIPILPAIPFRPHRDDPRSFFDKKGCQDLAPFQGRYLKPEYRPCIEALHRSLFEYRPEIVITLGEIPLWAVLDHPMTIKALTDNRVDHFCTLSRGGETLRFILMPAHDPHTILQGDKTCATITRRAAQTARTFLKSAMY